MTAIITHHASDVNPRAVVFLAALATAPLAQAFRTRATLASRSGGAAGGLEHWQHDTFIVGWRDRELRADAYVTFALDPDGNVEQAKSRGTR